MAGNGRRLIIASLWDQIPLRCRFDTNIRYGGGTIGRDNEDCKVVSVSRPAHRPHFAEVGSSDRLKQSPECSIGCIVLSFPVQRLPGALSSVGSGGTRSTLLGVFCLCSLVNVQTLMLGRTESNAEFASRRRAQDLREVCHP